MEQRIYPRVDVNAICHVFSLACGATDGTTENLSRGGILLRLASHVRALPAIGDVVSVDIELPTSMRFGRKYLHCRGCVVRILSARRSLPRIALSVSQMEFCDMLRKAPGKVVKQKAIERIFAAGRGNS